MLIKSKENLIIDSDSVKIVPITNDLDNIDQVRSLVRRVIKNEEYQGKILEITNYLINDDLKRVIIGSNKVNNVMCPFRNISRKI